MELSVYVQDGQQANNAVQIAEKNALGDLQK